MLKVKIFMLFPALLLCPRCAKQNHTPFHVDTVNGSYMIFAESAASSASGIVVNGKRILQDAYLFNENESLVAIGSVGELDMITHFSGDSTSGAIRLSLHNRGKVSLAVKQVELCSMPIEVESGLQLMIENHVSGLPWSLSIDRQGNLITCSLDLSNSSIILLPEEELCLPRLEFFYHLCAE